MSTDSMAITPFEPADEYEDYVAFLYGHVTVHVVDTTTFDNSADVINHDGTEYDGYTANVGEAETLCGRTMPGRMCPLDQRNEIEEQICGTCLRALKSREVDDGGE